MTDCKERPTGPRVLLADDDEITFALMLSLIGETNGWTVAAGARDRDGLMAAGLTVDADVCVISEGLLAVLSKSERQALAAANPGAVTLAVADGEEYDNVKRALRLGARDTLIVKPETVEVNRALIEQYFAETRAKQELLVRQAEFSMESSAVERVSGKVAVICGADGGTGKSFIALQLAGILAKHAAAKTLIVDGDILFSGLTRKLAGGVSTETGLPDLTTVMGEITAEHIARVAGDHPAGFSFLAGSVSNEARDNIEPTILAEISRAARGCYQAVIIDLPAGRIPKGVQDEADFIFTVMNPDAVSAGCARCLAGRTDSSDEAGARWYGLVNRDDRPDALPEDELARLSGLPIAASLPQDNGAGRLFDREGIVLADRTDLAIVRSIIPAAQRIINFEEFAPSRGTFPSLFGGRRR